ncbi:MAG: choice-of-anchor J domain-containing protein [Bacteroidales bacterium]
MKKLFTIFLLSLVAVGVFGQSKNPYCLINGETEEVREVVPTEKVVKTREFIDPKLIMRCIHYYTPGETKSFQIVFDSGYYESRWSLTEITFPENITVNSCSKMMDWRDRLVANPTINGQKIQFLRESLGEFSANDFDYFFSPNITVPADFNGDLNIQVSFIEKQDGTGDTFNYTLSIPKVKEGPTIEALSSKIEFGAVKSDSDDKPVKKFKFRNIGDQELSITSVEGLSNTPFKLKSSLPITISTLETAELEFELTDFGSGLLKTDAVIKSTGGDITVPITLFGIGSNYVCYDFEDLELPVAWASNKIKGALKWVPKAYNWEKAMVYYSGLDVSKEGDQAELITSPVQMIDVEGQNYLSFKIRHDNLTPKECVDVYISSDMGETWKELIMGANGKNDNSGFKQHFVLIEDYVKEDYVQFKFVATSQSTYTITLDDIILPINYKTSTPPEVAMNPTPRNGAQNLPIFQELRWEMPFFSSGVKLKFGINNPPTNEVDIKSAVSYQPNLLENTTYYWQAIPYNENGDAKNCPVWSFSTGEYTPTEWSDDPAKNLCVDPENGSCLQKIRVAPDGSYYIGWWDSKKGNYGVYMQHFSSSGEELWKHKGIVVCDYPQLSWLSDWDMQIDKKGNIVLAAPDMRKGYMTMNAYKVSPKGEMLWGKEGINLSGDDKTDEMSPELCVLDDNSVIVAWDYLKSAISAEGHIQRLDESGNIMWNDVIRSYMRPKLISIANNEFLLIHPDAMGVHIGRFNSKGERQNESYMKRLYSSKYGDVTVASDGKGGVAIASGYESGPRYYVTLGYMAPDGEIKWVSRPAVIEGNYQSMIDISYMKDEDKIFAAWSEVGQDQNQQELRAQLFDAETGKKNWAENGLQVIPFGEKFYGANAALTTGDRSIIIASSYGSDIPFPTVANAISINIDGTYTWTEKSKPIISVNNKRSKLIASELSQNQWVFAWEESRDGNRNKSLYLQNISVDGQLGVFNDVVPPKVYGIRFVTNNEMVLNFSEALQKKSAEKIKNYTIKDGPEAVVISKAELISSKKVKLTLTSIVDGNYNIKINGVKDLSFNSCSNYEVNFDFLKDIDAPGILSVDVLADNKIGIKFNEEVDETTAIIKSNYSLVKGSGEIVSVKKIKPDYVILGLSGIVNGDYSVQVDKVQDLRSNAMDKVKHDFKFTLNLVPNVYYFEDFADGMPADMKLIDEDKRDPKNEIYKANPWIVIDKDGNKMASSTSAFEVPGTADRYLITPAISVKKGACLSWTAINNNPGITETYEVLVSESTSDLENFVSLKDYYAEKGIATKNFFDLGDLGVCNTTIYIAFRLKTFNGDALNIDNIKVYQPVLNDLSMKYYSSIDYVVPNADYPIVLDVCNEGLSTVTGFEVSYSIDGAAAKTVSVSDLNMAFGDFALISLNGINPEGTGPKVLDVNITKVNTSADMVEDNDKVKVEFNIVDGASKRLVALEHFTNYACGPCASSNPVLEALLAKPENKSKAAHITYHVFWPSNDDPMYNFAKADNNNRIMYYRANVAPMVVVNGNKGVYSPSDIGQQFLDYENLRANLFSISGDVAVKGRDLTANLDLTSVIDLQGKDLVVYAMLTEDISLSGAPNGESFFPNVMRKILPSNKGLKVERLKKGGITKLELSYTLPEDIERKKTKMFVFVQNTKTKEVIASFVKEVQIGVGIDELNVNSDLSVYPNPANDALNIMFKNNTVNGQYYIYNVNGVLVKSGNVSGESSKIDLQDITSGVYFIKVIDSESYTKTIRFVKE